MCLAEMRCHFAYIGCRRMPGVMYRAPWSHLRVAAPCDRRTPAEFRDRKLPIPLQQPKHHAALADCSWLNDAVAGLLHSAKNPFQYRYHFVAGMPQVGSSRNMRRNTQPHYSAIILEIQWPIVRPRSYSGPSPKPVAAVLRPAMRSSRFCPYPWPPVARCHAHRPESAWLAQQ